jgi:DNA-binding transcriptional regulator YiaG
LDNEEIIRALLEKGNKDFLDIVSNCIANKADTPQQLRANIEAVASESRKKVYSQKDIPVRPKFDATMLHDALSFQLENEAAPRDVYSYVQDVYKKDDEWMKIAKHNEVNQSVRSSVASEVDKGNLPALERVDNLGLSIPSLIRDLKTPSKTIRKIDAYISLADRVDALEVIISRVEDRQSVTEIKIQLLSEATDTSININKLTALTLKKQGMSQKQIALQLNVHEKTVSRWFREIKDTNPILVT